tara:strand:+ start:740 stop:1285 length:546 start_codon:yes stop_codon:yes gene_type:complete
MRRKCGNPYYNNVKPTIISGTGMRPYKQVIYGNGIFSFIKTIFRPIARLFMKKAVPLAKTALNVAKREAPKLVREATKKAVEEGKKAIVEEGSKFVLEKAKDLGKNIIMGKKEKNMVEEKAKDIMKEQKRKALKDMSVDEIEQSLGLIDNTGSGLRRLGMDKRGLGLKRLGKGKGLKRAGH